MQECVGRGIWSREGRFMHSSIITYIMGYTIQVVNYRRGAKSGRDGLDASRSSTIREYVGLDRDGLDASRDLPLEKYVIWASRPQALDIVSYKTKWCKG